VSVFGTVMLLVAVGFYLAASWRRLRGERFQWRVLTTAMYLILFTVSLVGVIVYALDSDYWDAAWCALGVIWCGFLIWWLWRNGRDRRKAAGFLGAKSRALREKVVKKMRELQVPSPAPVPA
jgi:hypothetical protein